MAGNKRIWRGEKLKVTNRACFERRPSYLKNSAKNVIGESTKVRNNITNDKIKELSREQQKLKLDKEACQNKDKRRQYKIKETELKNY